MTDEEKEVIEYWKRELNHYEYTKDLDLASDNYFGQFEEKINMISGILNLIKKKQAEINALQMEHNHDVKMIDEVKGEAVRLYKINDEMATTLTAVCTGITAVREQFEKCYCEFINSEEDCCWKTDKTCKECIKDYFKKKVEDK